MATPDLTLGATRAPRTDAPKRRRRPRSVAEWVILIIAILIAILILSPFVLVLINSFKSPSDYASNGPLAIPTHLYLNGLETFWNSVNFPEKLWNSVLISGLVAIFGVAISALNAFALGIGRIRGRIWIVVLFLLANMLPQEAMIYPLYYMFKQVGLYDNVWAVIIILTVIESAFGTYLLSSVFSTFPPAVLEAAALDGASRWQIFTRVVIPISRPTLAVLLVFFFIWSWNEFLIPLVFLVSNDNQTVPLAVATLTGEKVQDVTTTSASALLGLLPTLIFFLIFQRTLTKGITAGAVK
jgi:raffinose/stachyose/melibiose transport system permease protein